MSNKPTPNQPYLKTWDMYQTERLKALKSEGACPTEAVPILLPITVDIDDGIVKRDLLTAADVKRFYKKNDDALDALGPKAKDIFKDFAKFFAENDVQGPRPESPLDFWISHPVWFLFVLPRKNWAYTDHTQISVENDDERANVEQIATLHKGRAILVSNCCRSAPENLKYNLHITITQTDEGGKTLKTDIIIDPGLNNDEGPVDP